MQVIRVNGISEVVSDYYDGIEVARDIMGDSWYSFMRQELLDADEKVVGRAVFLLYKVAVVGGNALYPKLRRH